MLVISTDLAREIDTLRSQLGADAQRNEIILGRLAVLERQLEAQKIAGAAIANEVAQRAALEQKRDERRLLREEAKLTIADVKRQREGIQQRRAELNEESGRIESNFAEIDAGVAAVRHQAEQERPDLVALLHETAEVQALRIERQALERRAVQIFVEQNQLRDKELQLRELLGEEENDAQPVSV